MNEAEFALLFATVSLIMNVVVIGLFIVWVKR